MAAGVDAARDMDAAFRQIIENDPEIQSVIRRVWGTGQRPSDTPDHLEKANHQASKEIGQILQRKGIQLPDRTFINPRSGTIEGHRGWAGMDPKVKAAIIAAAAGAATLGAGAAFGGFGGAAGGLGGGGSAAATGGSGLGVTSGLGSLAGVGATGVMPGVAGAGLGVTSGLGSLAGIGATGVMPGVAGGAAGTGGAMAGGAGLASKLGGLLKSPEGIGKLLETVGAVSGGIGANAAGDRQAGIDYSLLRDRLGLDANEQMERQQIDRADLDLRQRAEGRTAQNNAFTNSMRSAILGNWQPAKRPEGRTNISFLPQAGIDKGKLAADELSRQAMIELVEGKKFDELPALQGYDLSSPTQMPGASTSEKIADLIGLGGTAAGSLLQPKPKNNIEAWIEAMKR